MAIRDVWDPHDGKTGNPGEAREPGAPRVDAAFWDKKAAEARSRRDYEQEMALTDKIRNPVAPGSDSPIKIGGNINLGNFDLQKIQEETRAQADNIKKYYDDIIGKMNSEKEGYREQVHALQIQMLEQTFKLQMDAMAKMIQGNLARPGEIPFTEKMAEIEKYAGVLGYSKGSAAAGLDPHLQLEMLKMQHEEAHRQREHEWRIRQDEKSWTLQLKKFNSDVDLEREKLEAEKKKTEMIANAPSIIGRAIAQGLLDQGNPAEPIASRAPGPTGSAVPAGYHIEASIGESGTATCPNCQSPIGIAPNAATAICSKCNTAIPITRIGTNKPADVPPEAPRYPRIKGQEPMGVTSENER